MTKDRLHTVFFFLKLKEQRCFDSNSWECLHQTCTPLLDHWDKSTSNNISNEQWASPSASALIVIVIGNEHQQWAMGNEIEHPPQAYYLWMEVPGVRGPFIPQIVFYSWNKNSELDSLEQGLDFIFGKQLHCM